MPESPRQLVNHTLSVRAARTLSNPNPDRAADAPGHSAKKALLDEMPPWQGGGNMIARVTFEKSTFADPPARFEAGTATLGPAVGLGAAVDYLERIGMENVAWHERELMAYATDALSRIPGVRLIGTAAEKAGALSFVVDGISAGDMGRILDQDGIAVRAGPSLRSADDGSLRRNRHRAPVARAIQHAGRD